MEISIRCVHFIQEGWTGLMTASFGGYIDTVRVLLEAKADPNITNEVKLHYTVATVWAIVTWCIMLQDGVTALHRAAVWGHAHVVKLLVDYGAAVDIRSKVITLSEYNFLRQNIIIIMHVHGC